MDLNIPNDTSLELSGDPNADKRRDLTSFINSYASAYNPAGAATQVHAEIITGLLHLYADTETADHGVAATAMADLVGHLLAECAALWARTSPLDHGIQPIWFHAGPAGLDPGDELFPRSLIPRTTLIAIDKVWDGSCDELYGEGQEWRGDRVWLCATPDDAAWWGGPDEVIYAVDADDAEPLADPLDNWDATDQYHASAATIVAAYSTITDDSELGRPLDVFSRIRPRR